MKDLLKIALGILLFILVAHWLVGGQGAITDGPPRCYNEQTGQTTVDACRRDPLKPNPYR